MTGPKLDYNLNSETGEIDAPSFWLGATGGAGTASRADIFSRSQMRLADVNYSGCPCPDPAWYIKAPRVDLDFDENERSEERRVGKECVSTCRSRWSPYH